ncbi:hypothetical protein FNF29_00137 [Cafeteria roenbergensis]|uniref:Uncharacterized protein n=1 Tax=Cafeteria roenbergensis TaxID=33653 RepID=A0A5A8D0Q2_CAFRO|nr:hypothetical protein FNF29_00137 [Cafeteria roenbergensis]|eukprot:KAA0157561.1 hypothetical protein FNF29_00137 [Cafeteria roenbergensis]
MAAAAASEAKRPKLTAGFPGVLPRYYRIWERTTSGAESGEGIVLAVHNNGTGLLMLGPTHPAAVAAAAAGVKSVVFSDGSDSFAAPSTVPESPRSEAPAQEGGGDEDGDEDGAKTPASDRPSAGRVSRKRPRDGPVSLQGIKVSGTGKKGAPRVRTRTCVAIVTDGAGTEWPVVCGVSGRVLETNRRLAERPELLLRGADHGGLGHLLVLDVDGNLRKRLDPSNPPHDWVCLHDNAAEGTDADADED